MSRFSDLERMLTAALQGGATMQTIAEGNNPLGRYAAWKIWKDEAKHKVGPKGDPGAMTQVIVHPFNVPYDTGANALYLKTKCQSAALGFGGVTAVVCAHAGLTSQGIRIPQSNTVQAARAIVRNKTKGTEKTSRITGVKYTPGSTGSKSIPFGRDNSTDTYSAAVGRIAALVKTVGTHGVSFREEKWDEQIETVVAAPAGG